MQNNKVHSVNFDYILFILFASFTFLSLALYIFFSTSHDDIMRMFVRFL